MAPSEYHSCWERSNFSLKYLNWIWDLSWSLEFNASEGTQFVQQGCLFFHVSLANSTTNWVKIFPGLLFYAYVEIHQVRRLVFDYYQKCPVSLRAWTISTHLWSLQTKQSHLCLLDQIHKPHCSSKSEKITSATCNEIRISYHTSGSGIRKNIARLRPISNEAEAKI